MQKVSFVSRTVCFISLCVSEGSVVYWRNGTPFFPRIVRRSFSIAETPNARGATRILAAHRARRCRNG